MELQGSCRCGLVKFSCDSHTPCPYMRCYCSICRKVGGSGGFGINIMGQQDTFKVKGEQHVKCYKVAMPDEAGRMHPSTNARFFCGTCGSHLWARDPHWAEWVYPFAGAIDTELPTPPHLVHVLLGSKANWVEPQVGRNDEQYDGYPEDGIEEWHKKHKVFIKGKKKT